MKALQIVSSGEQAMAYLEGKPPFDERAQYPFPALVLLDLKLPGISGFELLSWIRQHARLARTQVVVLTGSKKGLDVYRAFELGADSFVAKPVGAADLKELGESLKLPWLALAENRGKTIRTDNELQQLGL
jgi:CheY-like chemotaxis protein